jgi:hypothetical protein
MSLAATDQSNVSRLLREHNKSQPIESAACRHSIKWQFLVRQMDNVTITLPDFPF